jgi:hypothetical protein
MASWFARFFEFEEDLQTAVAQRGHNKFDRVHAHLQVTSTGNGGYLMTVKSSGKQFWIGR